MSETPAKSTHPPMQRATTLPATPTSPLAENPWYRQKFEMVSSFSLHFMSMIIVFYSKHRDVIEERIREEYPDLPAKHKIEPAAIEHSILKGYDLDFPVRTEHCTLSYIANALFARLTCTMGNGRSSLWPTAWAIDLPIRRTNVAI